MSREITSEEQEIIDAAIHQCEVNAKYTSARLNNAVRKHKETEEEKAKKENPFKAVPDDRLSGIYDVMKDGQCYFRGDEEGAKDTCYWLNQGYRQALKDVEKSKKESEEYHKDIKIDEHRGPGR